MIGYKYQKEQLLYAFYNYKIYKFKVNSRKKVIIENNDMEIIYTGTLYSFIETENDQDININEKCLFETVDQLIEKLKISLK